MRRFVSIWPAMLVILATALVLVAVPEAVRRINVAAGQAQVILARRVLDGDDVLARLNASVRAVADAVRPGVVHLEIESEGSRRGGRSSGSGWLYDEAGHVVTSAHVVRGATRVAVQFADGRVVRAQPIRGALFLADPYTDIAVLKVASGNGTPLARATGEPVRQGDRVFAFGSPFGFRFSMSEGIVSGLGREPAGALEFGGFTNFIQTDAAVNPGNSGGPLVDIRGRVVGMNAAIATGRPTQGMMEGQSAGISFAIPLATIESVVGQLIETGRVSRGFLGISWQLADDPVTYDESARTVGVRVWRVEPDGPADAAGIVPGDLIVALDGLPVQGVETLRAAVTARRPGETVRVSVLRQGQPMDFTVRLGEFPVEWLARSGVRAMLLRAGLLLGDSRQGPRVRAVLPDSLAGEAGFAEDQVITQVGGRPVRTVDEVLLAAAEAGLLLGRSVEFTVLEPDAGALPRTLQLQVGR